MRTPLTEMLGIARPLLLAPMGNVSGGALSAAVSNAGGLGLIGGGYGDPDWLRRELDAAGDARVGVGFITWALEEAPGVLDIALERGPAAVMLSFGDFTPFVDRIHDAGARLICQIQTLQQAKQAVDGGADVIVAQGTEAGGHGGGRGTFALVPAVADAVAPVPVVAAGGIADGRGLAAALTLGAAGVLVGTAFYAAEESLAPEAGKQAVARGGGDDTVRTTIFDIVRGYDWPSPYTGRALVNDFVRRWHGREQDLKAQLADEQVRYARAAASGDADTAVVFAGEAMDLIQGVRRAGDIVRAMAGEAERLLRDGPQMLQT